MNNLRAYATRCPKCGSQSILLGDENNAKGKCEACGYDIGIEVERSRETIGREVRKKRVRVLVSTPPTSKEISVVRKLVPEFERIGISEIKKRLEEQKEWVLGEYYEYEFIRTIEPKVKNTGVTIIMNDIERGFWKKIFRRKMILQEIAFVEKVKEENK